MKNNYNDDNKFASLIKDLKKLPKEKASDNFEHNLMIRIQNKNFGSQEEVKPEINWFRFFAPSAAVVTAIILLFIFLPFSQQNNSLVVNQGAAGSNEIVKNVPEVKESTAKLNSVKSSQGSAANNLTASAVKEKADLSAKSRLPFNGTRSIAVDEFVSGARSNRREINGGNIVSSGDNTAPDGFFISGKPDQKTLNKYRATVDSVKKAQIKADSLKKIQKMP